MSRRRKKRGAPAEVDGLHDGGGEGVISPSHPRVTTESAVRPAGHIKRKKNRAKRNKNTVLAKF